jgi:hypothetical protein
MRHWPGGPAARRVLVRPAPDWPRARRASAVTRGRESGSGGCGAAGSQAARRGGSRGLRCRAAADAGRIHPGRPPRPVGGSVLSITGPARIPGPAHAGAPSSDRPRASAALPDARSPSRSRASGISRISLAGFFTVPAGRPALLSHWPQSQARGILSAGPARTSPVQTKGDQLPASQSRRVRLQGSWRVRCQQGPLHYPAWVVRGSARLPPCKCSIRNAPGVQAT